MNSPAAHIPPPLPGEKSAEGADRPAEGRSAPFRWTALVETLLFTGAILLFNRFVHPDDPGYLSVRPHPLWVVILLISVRYSFKISIPSALIVAAAYSYFILFPARGGFQFSALSIFSDFGTPVLFLIVAGFISGFTQHLLERTQVLRGQVRERDAEIGELRAQNQAATQALRRLEGRIAGEFTSILDLFAELARTRRMDSAQIKSSLLDVLQQYLDVEKASYYDVERGRLIRRFAIGGDLQTAEAPEEDVILSQALNAEGIIHLGHFSGEEDLDRYEGLSLLTGTLRNAAGEPVGLVSVERIPFVDYNPHTFKLFDTLLQWWSSSLDEAMRLEELRAQSTFDSSLGLYNYGYFSSRIAQEFRRTMRFSLPMSLALLRIEDFSSVRPDKRHELRQALARIATGVITELEMAAQYRSEELIAISFPIAMAEDAEKRMREIAAQIEAFDFHPYQDPDLSLNITWGLADYEIGMESHEELIARVERQLEGGADA